MRKRFSGSTALLLLALAVIAGATLAPTGFAPSGFSGGSTVRVMWCFTCGANWLTDDITNVALFVPLGISLALQRPGVLRALFVGAAVSLFVEFMQHLGLPPGRQPSLSDWLTNSIGTLVGALLVLQREVLLRPTRAQARTLAPLWSALLVATMLGTSWALSPRRPSVGATSRVVLSALPFTPGYGWFAAVPESASVNGVTLTHGGTGPVIAELQRTDTVRAQVTVRGRDDRRGTVPIVYAHAPGDRAPIVLLGQRGNHATLRTTMMGRRLGLTTPDLVVHGAFADGDNADSLVRRHLAGVVTAGVLSLQVERDGTPPGEWQGTLTLRPSLGWTLIQSLIRADAWIAPLLSLVWIALWFVVGGYWLGVERLGVWIALGWCVAMILIVGVGTARFGMPALGWIEATCALGASALGAGLARYRARYLARDVARSIDRIPSSPVDR